MIEHDCIIGNAQVKLQLDPAIEDLFSGLAHFRQLPDQTRGEVITVTISPVSTRDWELDIEATAACYQKGLSTHCTTLDHERRHVSIRLLEPVSAVATYLVYRDLFCCLGGLQGDPLLHASCVIHDEQAYVFMAESGGGKSTIGEMLRSRSDWVNDEIIWMTETNGQFGVVNQGLWRGDTPRCQKRTVPIRHLHLLEKAERCRRQAITAMDVYAMMLGAPFDGCDPNLAARAVATGRLAEVTPAFSLQVPLDADAVASVVFS